MFAERDAQATLPVKNLERARSFYEGILGLKPVGSYEPGVQVYAAGQSKILVYETTFAGTNQATAMSWPFGKDFDKAVSALKAKGITFERYDMPQATFDGDVYTFGDMRMTWFKDPDGNIINIGNYGE